MNPWGDNSRRNSGDGAISSRKNSWFKPKEETIGEYAVGKTIGSGGVGSVRRAEHIDTGGKVIILFTLNHFYILENY